MIAEVPAKRAQGYAARFLAETVGLEPPDPREPTDENLAAILSRCVRKARPEEFPAIREIIREHLGVTAACGFCGEPHRYTPVDPL